MKRDDTIKFRVVRYNSDLELERETDQVLEGIILYAYAGNFTVQVGRKKQPYFVEPQYILSG